MEGGIGKGCGLLSTSSGTSATIPLCHQFLGSPTHQVDTIIPFYRGKLRFLKEKHLPQGDPVTGSGDLQAPPIRDQQDFKHLRVPQQGFLSPSQL